MLAALVIIAAAGPLWNPPAATSSSKAPLALLIDDGFPAAPTWDARMRMAEDLIARAEADHRGIALIPRAEPSRDVSFELPAAARVRLKQIKPKPYAVERADALPALGRFLGATPEVEFVWLTDGVDLGGGSDFVSALARLVEQRPMTVIEGGLATAHALSGADNAAGALTVKVLRAASGAAETGTVRALGPFADVRVAERGSPAQVVSQFIEQRLPMLILADVGNVAEARDQLTRWLEDGGVLVRFAGPRLAAGDDDLVPVRLRRGGRILGGSLSWEQPQQLSAFPHDSPFFGMAVPSDVTVTRQVLAEPDATLNERTWAALTDGTPLVTAQRRGKGLIILFHVTADTRWSDLPLSGTFVEMLKRIVSFAGSVAASDGAATQARDTREVLPPARILDGFGAFGPPPTSARAVPATFSGRATFDHPPGFYGPPEGLLAVNTLAPNDRLAPLDTSALNARRDTYRTSEPEDLRGPILLAALGLLVLDALVIFLLAGGIGQFLRRRRPAATALVIAILAAALVASPHAFAQGQPSAGASGEIGRASWRERGWIG